MTKFASFLVILGLLSGCASRNSDTMKVREALLREELLKTQIELNKKALQEQEARQRPQPQPQPQRRRLTLAESIEVCQKVDNDKSIPFRCYMGNIEGAQIMFFAFQNEMGMNNHWATITETFAADYCTRSNASNIVAGVNVFLIDTRQARFYSCKTNEMTEWTYIPEQGNSRSQSGTTNWR